MTFSPNAAVVYEDGPTGSPSQPAKPQIRSLLTSYEVAISALSGSGTFKGTWDASAGTFPGGGITTLGDRWVVTKAGIVNGRTFSIGDTVIAAKVNASTTTYLGNWATIPTSSRVILDAADSGAGTPNAIQVTTEDGIGARDGEVVTFSLFEDTTGSPVTVSVDGGPLLTMKTSRGLNATALTEDMEIWGRVRSADNTFRLLTDQDVSALVAQAEEAAAEAVAAASSVQTDPVTRAYAISSYHPSVAPSKIRTSGYAAAGDLGGGLYKLVGSEPAHAGKLSITLADAVTVAWYELAETKVNFAMFGGKWNNRATAVANGAAFGAMMAYCDATGAGFDLGAGNLFLDMTAGGWVINEGIRGYGRGQGYWHPVPIKTGVGATKYPAPTQIVLCGTCPKDYNYFGVSSMKVCGAARTNPSARVGFNDDEYRLYSFMNDDGTPKDFSIALLVKSDSVSLDSFRVVPDWGGDDGLDGYNNASAVGWSDGEVDFGIWVDARARQNYTSVAVVGTFRGAGIHVAPLRLNPADGSASPYQNRFTDCVFQGFVGMMIRGSDKWKITGTGTDWIQLPYAEDHPFVSEVFSLVVQNTASFSVASMPDIVSVDTSVVPGRIRLYLDGTHSLVGGDMIVPLGINGGNSHNLFTRCAFHGITHPSGHMAHDQLLTDAYDCPSASWQMSGFRMTETEFINCTDQSIEEIGGHAHEVAFTTCTEWKIEGSNHWSGSPTTSLTTGRHRGFICSPVEADNSHADFPAGNTYNFVVDSITLNTEDRHDLRPMVPTGDTPFTAVGDNGFFEPNRGACVQYHGTPNTAGGFLRPSPDGEAGLKFAGFPSAANAITADDLSKTVKLYAPFTHVGESAITGVTGSGVSSVVLLGSREVSFFLTTENTGRIAIAAEAGGAGILQLSTNSHLTARQGGLVAFDVASSTGTSIIAGANLTNTLGTSSKINVEAGSGYIDVQNNTGSTIVFRASISGLI